MTQTFLFPRTPQLFLWVFALALGLVACDCDGGGGKGDGSVVIPGDGGGTGDCESDNPPASCGAPCDGDGDCGAGTHCGPADECVAECGPPGSDCSAELVCDLSGRCRPRLDGDAGGGDSDACVDVELAPERVVPNVVLLVDKSGSMDKDDIDMGSATLRRWNALRELLIGRCASPSRDPGVEHNDRNCSECTALVPGNVGIVGETHDVVNYGLMIYPGTSTSSTCDDRIRVPTAPMNYPAIRDTFMETRCAGGTPTREAFQDLMSDPQLYDPNDPDPTIVILATDGEPNNCACTGGFGGNSNCWPCCSSNGTTERNNLLTTVRDAYDDGVTTYVVAIAGNPLFQNLANAGQGDPPENAIFYSASDGTVLQAALEEIIQSNLSCEIDLHATVTAADLCKGTVTLDGTPLECNGAHGFSRIDDRHVRLHGDACESWKSDANASLQAKWPCGAVIIIPPG